MNLLVVQSVPSSPMDILSMRTLNVIICECCSSPNHYISSSKRPCGAPPNCSKMEHSRKCGVSIKFNLMEVEWRCGTKTEGIVT